MIRSMTGFGEAEHRTEDLLLRVQIKTVNHRFLNTSVRTPPGFDRVEHEIQHWLRDHLSRGHVSVSVTMERDEAKSVSLPRLDSERVEHYLGQLRQLQGTLGLDGPVDLAAILRFSDIFQAPEPRERVEVDADWVRPAIEAAARAVVAHREAEGARLKDDLNGRLSAMSALLDRVSERAPLRLAAERDRLRAQIAELVGSDDVDDDRFAREVAYMAEKWDINEEIVRFRAHIELFEEACESAEPIGKRLSFLVQEMHREANTIGSKANDAEISHAAVSLKEEIERLREQVENVE